MIGLRQEKKAPLTRSGGAREKFFQVLPLAVFASRRLFLLDAEPDIHLLSQPPRPPQKIELVISWVETSGESIGSLRSVAQSG